jgi:hypothetical protein
LKQLILLYGDNCGYCKKAKMLLRRALSTHPEFLPLDIRYVYDQSDEAMPYKHQLIPALYCGGLLFFEGNPDMDTVMAALNCCLLDSNSEQTASDNQYIQ